MISGDSVVCDSCEKKHERYFRKDGKFTTWQIVGMSARTEFLGDVSVQGEVCREGNCSDVWLGTNADVLVENACAERGKKFDAETIIVKQAGG